jgi:hypothetical protein
VTDAEYNSKLEYLNNIKQLHNYFTVNPGILDDELFKSCQKNDEQPVSVKPKTGGAMIVRKEKFKDNRTRNVYKIGRTFYVNYNKEIVKYKDLKDRLRSKPL